MSLSRSELRRVDEARIVRLATVSRRGTPLVTPLWFARDADVIYIGTRRSSPHSRNVADDPRVVMVFSGPDGRVMRVTGAARLCDDEMSLGRRARMAWRYFLGPSALAHWVRHWRKLGLRKAYYRERTDPAMLEVTLDEAEVSTRPGQPRSHRSRNHP